MRTAGRPRRAGSRCCPSSASSADIWPARAGRTTARPARSAAIVFPSGLRESDRLPEPIFTPATKAQEGHDENIDRERAAELVGADLFAQVERISLELYRFAADYALERGIVIADTKFELGVGPDGVLTLGDEALTPDSSRFWPADEYEPGRGQPSFDKQYVRDYCESLGWDKSPPGPELPDEVVAGTRARYVEAFEQLTGIRFDDYLGRPGDGAPVKATVLVRPKGGILDPQGEAVERSLRQLGFEVGEARVGRVIDLEVDAPNAEEARSQLERMCENLLANPLIESYEIELEERGT